VARYCSGKSVLRWESSVLSIGAGRKLSSHPKRAEEEGGDDDERLIE